MSNQIYNPGVGGAPFGAANANPQASPYAQNSAYGVTQTILLDKAVKPLLFDAAPAKFNILKVLFDKEFKQYSDDVFEYLEYTFARNPIELAANVIAAPPVIGSAQTQVLTLTAPSMQFISNNSIIVFPDTNETAIVRVVGPGNTITIETPTSGGIPAINIATQNPILPVMSSISADGRQELTNYQRTQTITRYNYIQQFQRAARWGRWELQKYKNNARTNYLTVEVEERKKQIRYDLFATFINGTIGEYRLATGEIAKATNGIYPIMVQAGSPRATATTATLPAVFESLVFQSDFKAEGAVRFVLGAEQPLYELSKSYKEAGVRYAPNDMIANLNLTEYKIGTCRIVPIPCELLREPSLFPPDFATRLFILDMETITPVVMQGIPAMEAGMTLPLKNNGTREQFMDFWILAQMGVEMNNPLASAIIDLNL